VRPQEIAQYNALGCLGVLAKPFDPATLPEKLESLWGGRWEAPTAAARASEFEALRRVYVAELPDRIAAMQAAAGRLAAGGWDRGHADRDDRAVLAAHEGLHGPAAHRAVLEVALLLAAGGVHVEGGGLPAGRAAHDDLLDHGASR